MHEYGITNLQYLSLLHIKGYRGRDWATVGELAERLQTHRTELLVLKGVFKIPRARELG